MICSQHTACSLSIGLLFAACQSPFEPGTLYDTKPLHELHASAVSLEVSDRRSATSEIKLKWHHIGLPGLSQEFAPALNRSQEQWLLAIAEPLIDGVGAPVHFEVQVLEATCGWQSSRDWEAHVKLHVTARTGSGVISGEGESVGRDRSYLGQRLVHKAALERIYRDVFIDAFVDFLSRAEALRPVNPSSRRNEAAVR